MSRPGEFSFFACICRPSSLFSTGRGDAFFRLGKFFLFLLVAIPLAIPDTTAVQKLVRSFGLVSSGLGWGQERSAILLF